MPPNKHNKTLLIIIVVLLIALGGLGYWYWYKTKQLNTDVSAKQSQIATLESEKAKLTAEATEESTSDKSSDYITIKEWGVKFKPGSELSDLVYYTNDDIAYLSTRSLMSSAKAALKPDYDITTHEGLTCNPVANPIGIISRGKKDKQILGATYGEYEGAVKVGDYYYIFQGPQSSCSADKATTDLAIKQNQAVKVAIKTITVAK